MSSTPSKTRAALRTDAVRAAFEANYIDYQYRWVEFFIEHFADLSRTFRGDLQSMMVLGLVGQVHLRAVRGALKAGIAPDAVPVEWLSINASRIADVTGIPRETVRRKLVALNRKGWLVRTGDASWRLAVTDGVSVARKDLAAIDRRAMLRLARLFRDFESLVDSHTARASGAAQADGAQARQQPVPVSPG